MMMMSVVLYGDPIYASNYIQPQSLHPYLYIRISTSVLHPISVSTSVLLRPISVSLFAFFRLFSIHVLSILFSHLPERTVGAFVSSGGTHIACSAATER